MLSELNRTRIGYIERLIKLINPSTEDAQAQMVAFHQEISEWSPEELDEYSLMLSFKGATEWKSSYYVDWKDTESLVASLSQISVPWVVQLDWGTNDPMNNTFLNSTDVTTLLDQIYGQFEKQGLRLWGWDTSGDAYGGWLSRIEHDDEITHTSKMLGVDFWIDCTGYSDTQISPNDLPHENNMSNASILKLSLQNLKPVLSDGSLKQRLSILFNYIKFILLLILLVPLIALFKGLLKLTYLIQGKK